MENGVMERLMIPPARTLQRAQREAIKQVMKDQADKRPFLDVENRHSLTSSALLRLTRHHFDGGVLTKAQDLVALSDRFIQTKGAKTCFATEDRWRGFLQSHRDLKKAVDVEIRTWSIACEDIELFLGVTGAWRDLLLMDGYDPAEIARSEVVALAELIRANFEAYVATLNADV
ncbi:hypothetical protein HYT05_00230 [Candidatus Kaiserbacteria bacterium]|nr:hypothetical protein [Candidatus Kaiserbacteria bacterium]